MMLPKSISSAIGALVCSVPLVAGSAAGLGNVTSEPPDSAIQAFLINARDKECIAQMGGRRQAVQPFVIRQVSTGIGSQAEFLVLARGECFCSPTGNCSFWVLVPSGSTFAVILSTFRVEGIQILPSATSGHPDLELFGHNSAFETTHVLYRFDGTRYRRGTCVEWSYQDEKDPERILKTPRISPCEKQETTP